MMSSSSAALVMVSSPKFGEYEMPRRFLDDMTSATIFAQLSSWCAPSPHSSSSHSSSSSSHSLHIYTSSSFAAVSPSLPSSRTAVSAQQVHVAGDSELVRLLSELHCRESLLADLQTLFQGAVCVMLGKHWTYLRWMQAIRSDSAEPDDEERDTILWALIRQSESFCTTHPAQCAMSWAFNDAPSNHAWFVMPISLYRHSEHRPHITHHTIHRRSRAVYANEGCRRLDCKFRSTCVG
jgi:hypothetical protein